MSKISDKLSLENYIAYRNQFIAFEESKAIGSTLILSHEEELVNKILMEKKWKELDSGMEDPNAFLASQHIFDVLKNLERSDVFKIIKMLPKGASLHCHDLGLVSSEYLFTLTYSNDLYARIVDNKIQFKFLKYPEQDTTHPWEKVEELRRNASYFDKLLQSQMTLIHPQNKTVDANTIWCKFMDCFTTVEPIICYKPIFKKYFYQVLQELHEDNVMYLEFRTILPTVYDLDGKTYGPIEVAGLYKEVTDEFLRTHDDFLGVKLIYAPIRSVNQASMYRYIETTKALKNKYPDFFAGFDLVGQEDTGTPLLDFYEKLQEMKTDIKLFFHAGETNWHGSKIDLNLIDAVLLDTVRIGHGFATLKHVDVMKTIKIKNIAIECCPISNQVLMLVRDLRNHPVTHLIASNYPVVICNDDPSFWGVKGLSYDWYMVFMAMTSRNMSLKFLKQMAMNSLEYSVYKNKSEAMKMWQSQWKIFIEKMLCNNIGNI